MNYTNIYNLPDLMIEAITSDEYERKADPNRISVTRLIDSPLMKRLMDIHAGEMESDYSDRLWILDGKATHSAMEKINSTRWEKEYPISEEINGMTVSGRLDVFDKETGTIIDYKRTSIWSIIFQSNKIEHENQLNVYAYLMKGAGFDVKKLEIYRFLKDWRKSEARKGDANYPPIPFVALPIDLWDDRKAEEYLFERVRLHKEALKMNPEEMEPCSPAERWAKPDTFAVYTKTKDGKKFKERADRVLDTDEQAQSYIQTNQLGDSAKIEFRKGADVRCSEYCDVSQFCPYWKKKLETEANKIVKEAENEAQD